jgi:uncharacterized membrane protein
MNVEKRMKLWRLLALVLTAIIIVYALFIDDFREAAKLERDVNTAEARRRWAVAEYERHKLEQQGVECRKDAC